MLKCGVNNHFGDKRVQAAVRNDTHKTDKLAAGIG